MSYVNPDRQTNRQTNILTKMQILASNKVQPIYHTLYLVAKGRGDQNSYF